MKFKYKNKIMIRFYILLVIMVSSFNYSSNCFASAWAKAYGSSSNDAALSLDSTNDGGYIIAGYTYSVFYDIWVLKLDSQGIVQWQKRYDAFNYDAATSVLKTADGGYIIAATFGLEFWEPWIIKLNSLGEVQWDKVYSLPLSAILFLQQTSDGGYIGVGYSGYNILIVKLDSTGNGQWEKIYGGSSYDYAYSIQQTSDGGYIVAGETASFGSGDYDIWILKLDSTGGVQWQKTYGGSFDDSAASIQQTNDGGYIIAGKTNSFG